MLRRMSILASMVLLVSCGPPRENRIVVGSKNFTEQLVMGELIAQQIEAKTKLPVERRFYLAGTYICQQAILAGRIDVYPEYTGTALTAVLKQKAEGGAESVYRQVKNEYAKRFGLSVGPTLLAAPLPSAAPSSDFAPPGPRSRTMARTATIS